MATPVVIPKRKKIIYKVADFMTEFGDKNVTLESLVKSATKKVKVALDRMVEPAGDDETHFLNYQASHHGEDAGFHIYGCELLAFKKGADQSVISIAKDKTEVDLDAIPAGKEKEYVAGSIYFAIHKNHVILMSSRGFGPKELEQYLNWFLIQKAGVVADGNLVMLKDHIPAAKLKKKNIKGVNKITLSAPVSTTAPSVQVGSKEETKTQRVQLGGTAWEAFKNFVGLAVDVPTNINVKDLTETPEIEITLEVTWKKRIGQDDDTLLDGIASNLRHIDDEIDYNVHTKAGSFTRADFKHFTHIQTNWFKGRPKFEGLFPNMAEWLDQLLKQGIIDP